MKEHNSEDSEEDDFNNNLDKEKFNEISGFNQNKIISPLASKENSPKINNNIELKEGSNNYNYNQNYINNISRQSQSRISSFIDDNVNENYQFIRYHLKDEEKKVLTPRNTTFFYKIFDLLINW